MNRLFRPVLGLVVGALLAGPVFAEQTVKLDIVSQPLADALRKLGTASNTNIMFEPAMVSGIVAPALKGEVTAKEALTRLLAGTKWTFKFVDANTVSLVPAELAKTSMVAPEPGLQVAQAGEAVQKVEEASASTSPDLSLSQDASQKGIPEILVHGSKVLNMDIPRDRDSAQPYVVFDRIAIENSGAATLDDFLRTRLPSNSSQASFGQQPFSMQLAGSQINLRGLGTAQTLILIDGRRTAGTVSFGSGGGDQTDISGIPLAAIERIEVLPTTASSIYGGSATGGVVNIIMRRDYAGVEVKLTQDNTFGGEAGLSRVDISTGFNLAGKTNLLLAGSYARQDGLRYNDRDFLLRARQKMQATVGYAGMNYQGVPFYGSTPNILSADGSNLTLKSGGTALGSPFTFVPTGYRGPQTDNGAALVANAGRYNLDLSSAPGGMGGGGNYLLPNTETRSIQATLRHELSPRLQFFVDGRASGSSSDTLQSAATSTLYNPLPGSATSNPFNQAIYVAVPVDSVNTRYTANTKDYEASAGVIVKLPANWAMEVNHTYHRSFWEFDSGVQSLTPDFYGAFGSGALNVLVDTALYPVDYSPYLDTVTNVRSPEPLGANLRSTALHVAGPVKLSFLRDALQTNFLVETKKNTIEEFTFVQSGFLTVYTPPRAQSVDSVYGEVRIPLIGAAQGLRGKPRLELQISGRYDAYTTTGKGTLLGFPDLPSTAPPEGRNKVSSTNPLAALRVQVLPDLALRASWGTGFLPPGVQQLVRIPSAGPGNFVDPRRGGTAVTIPGANYLRGGNPDLQPEDSKTVSGGFVFTPSVVPGLRLSVDYTRIRKTDNITAFNGQSFVDNEDLFPGRVTRGAKLITDPAAWAGPIIAVDTSLVNIASAKVQAYDFQLDYRRDTAAFGLFDFSLLGTRTMHYQTQLLPGQPVSEQVGVGSRESSTSNPLAFKANAALSWTKGALTLGWNTQYFHSYWLNATHTVDPFQGSATVPRQVYHDVFGRWNFDGQSGSGSMHSLLADTELTVGIKNVFDKEPPIVATTSYTGYSLYGDPRLSAYYLSLKKSF